MTNPSSLNIPSPALISSTLGAVAPFIGLAPGELPTIPAAAAFLRSPSAAKTIHDRFKLPYDPHAAFGMARFFERISGPPPAVAADKGIRGADAGRKFVERWARGEEAIGQ